MLGHCHPILLFSLEMHFQKTVSPEAHELKNRFWGSGTLCPSVWTEVLGEERFWGHLSLETPLKAQGPSWQRSWREHEQSICCESLFLRMAEAV
jgi:hypothetical protein